MLDKINVIFESSEFDTLTVRYECQNRDKVACIVFSETGPVPSVFSYRYTHHQTCLDLSASNFRSYTLTTARQDAKHSV